MPELPTFGIAIILMGSGRLAGDEWNAHPNGDRFGHLGSQHGGIMSHNIGTIDRVIRIMIGLVLIAYAIPLGLPHTGWNWTGWIGVIPILTAIFGVCPLYRVLGISTGA